MKKSMFLQKSKKSNMKSQMAVKLNQNTLHTKFFYGKQAIAKA